ncbi:ATP-binding protein [uncultured Ruminococcus sp.]|uniref:ATP-binding protein n=1 Tax=uncultured Ruminococcus sp. TaxID=165186 RepID=UPI0025FA8B46|nr:ATP-binding protein [uncultured Ruminococcus sp.]
MLERKSIIHFYTNFSAVSNQPFSKWTDVFGDAVIANAIIDRLVHHCEVIKITGNSYRIKGRKIFDDSDD